MKNKTTPLHYAAEQNCEEMGELLISKGANIYAKNMNYLRMIVLFLIKRIFHI